MSEANHAKAGWKQRVRREFIGYWFNFTYLAIFLGAFAWYRRLILAEYHITYLNYGVALLEALVLAKVILVGEALGLGRGHKDKPLIIPTLEKSLVFTLLVGLFAVLERMVDALLEGRGFAGGVHTLLSVSKYELLARCLVTFCAFIPFFAFRELRTKLGEGKLYGWFFKRRAVHETGPADAEPAI